MVKQPSLILENNGRKFALILFYREDFLINNERVLPKPTKDEDLVNENIRFPTVLVISPTGESLGAMPRLRALQLAETYNLDLLCVSKTSKIPVCKILDYGKYRFESQKKAKENKKNQKQIETKEVQLSPQIGIHDLETKARHAERFLADGKEVRIVLRFRGRQLAHVDVGEKVMQDFIDRLSEFAVIKKPPLLDKKLLVCILSPKSKK